MAEIEINEETFHNAVNNAGPLAKQRLLRKMAKTNPKTGLPPKDLEAYVTNFVQTFYKAPDEKA